MAKKIYKIIVFGPQGSGKGTQAELIEKEYGIPAISTGNLFRIALSKGSKWGKEAKKYMDKGELVPDEVTNNLIAERLKETDCQGGFILDGYPRNIDQLGLIEKLVEPTHVFNIKISDEEAIKRLQGRLSCSCGMVYHNVYNPPKNEMRCDECGGELYVRADDVPEAIKNRLKIYHEQTEPLLSFYREKGVLHEINGERSIEEVWQDVRNILEKF